MYVKNPKPKHTFVIFGDKISYKKHSHEKVDEIHGRMPICIFWFCLIPAIKVWELLLYLQCFHSFCNHKLEAAEILLWQIFFSVFKIFVISPASKMTKLNWQFLSIEEIIGFIKTIWGCQWLKQYRNIFRINIVIF